jgi:hypothetical protein
MEPSVIVGRADHKLSIRVVMNVFSGLELTAEGFLCALAIRHAPIVVRASKHVKSSF